MAGGLVSFDPEVGAQLDAARELLGMELAYIAEVSGGYQAYRAASGDTLSFGLEVGDAVPLDQSPCSVVGGTLPTAIADTGRREGVRSYVGVPLRLSDGEVFGYLCCLSGRPNRSLGQREVRMLEVLARLIADRIEHDRLAADRRALERENGRRQIEATGVGAFLAALEIRDSYTGRHCDAVVELALDVAEVLDVELDRQRAVGQVALLHDIGKIGVPDAVLQKPGPLDDEEWKVMRSHPEVGAQMVSSVIGLGHLAPAVRAEHERWDGNGYPDGLRGEEIPVESRIVFACDAFHAMTSDRPYRRALPRSDAIAELELGRGSQFCPVTVDALLTKVTAVDGASAVAA